MLKVLGHPGLNRTAHTPGIDRVRVADGPHGLRMQPDEADHVGIGGSLPARNF